MREYYLTTDSIDSISDTTINIVHTHRTEPGGVVTQWTKRHNIIKQFQNLILCITNGVDK